MSWSMRSPVRFLAPWVLLGMLFPGSAWGLNYKPRPEESLSHVALIHYGESKKIVYLMAANGIDNPDKIAKGATLWVPTVWKYIIKKGDDLAQVAAKHLKDPKRADFLIWLNRIQDPKDVKPGTVLQIPFVLRHRAQSGQSMVDIAKRYYFTTRPTALLRKFNNQKTNALKAGDIVFVPIYDPEASYEKVSERLKYFKDQEGKAAKAALKLAGAPNAPDPDKVDKPDSEGSLVPDACAPGPDGTETCDPEENPEDAKKPADTARSPADAALIQQGFDLYRDGEYELAQAQLARVLEKGTLAKADEAEAREILASCLVALERPQEAEHEFVRLLMVDPERTLDPVTTSPKILELFKRAKGAR